MPIYSLGGATPELPLDGQFWMAPDASIIGRVKLELDVGIWFGAVLRGDRDWIFVGKGTNIQDGCVLHTDPGAPLTIGDGCTIGHRVILHGCTIGPNTLIGMGATILNHAKIGANCIVGANALVTESKKFPDNSLIFGAPAKFIRMVDVANIEINRNSAQRYIENWRRYKAELMQLSARVGSITGPQNIT